MFLYNIIEDLIQCLDCPDLVDDTLEYVITSLKLRKRVFERLARDWTDVPLCR